MNVCLGKVLAVKCVLTQSEATYVLVILGTHLVQTTKPAVVSAKIFSLCCNVTQDAPSPHQIQEFKLHFEATLLYTRCCYFKH